MLPQKGQKPKAHDCRKHNVGSSKSMEPNVTVELFQRAIKDSFYTGDDDTTIRPCSQGHVFFL